MLFVRGVGRGLDNEWAARAKGGAESIPQLGKAPPSQRRRSGAGGCATCTGGKLTPLLRRRVEVDGVERRALERREQVAVLRELVCLLARWVGEADGRQKRRRW